MGLPKMDYVSTLIEHQNCTWCQLPCALRRAGYIKLPCFCFWVFSPCVRDVSSIKIRTFPPSGFLHRIQPKLILLGDAKSTSGPKNRNNLFKNMPITPGRTFGGCIISHQIPWREGVILLNSDMAKTGCFSRCFCTGRKGRSVARGVQGYPCSGPATRRGHLHLFSESPCLFFLLCLTCMVHISIQASRCSLPSRHGILAKAAWIKHSKKTWSLFSNSWSLVTKKRHEIYLVWWQRKGTGTIGRSC